ncbi:uncharacterized mitochondrial protein AtMg00810-like [Rutidosis leptorrhynchoides]|uniref:uncharacterized mitochondrial protein AtMg00810-like n=1 Tax=Rutidosis leptorrhynchoides TaxID=125765 RepID=UPI003A9A539E
MTDLGPLNYFLGIYVTRNSIGLFLSQRKYATEILECVDMLYCKPCRTPINADSKLGDNGPTVSDPTLYRSLAGSLISQLLNGSCATFERLFDMGLQLYASSTCSPIAYSDTDWEECPITRRSTSDYCVLLDNNLLSLSSKRQHTPSRSSAEVEYRGVANAVAETSWLFQNQQTKYIEIDIHFVRDLVATGHV